MTWSEILFISAMFVPPALVCLVLYYFLAGGRENFARKPLDMCYRGIEIKQAAGPGDVYFVYHTYRGLLFWATEDEHRVIASRADAEKLLERLLNFNLTWGLLSHGGVFIPPLATGNYHAQLASIRRQVEDAELSGLLPRDQRI